MSSTVTDSSHELYHFFAVPRRRWGVVVSTALVTGAVSVLLLSVLPSNHTAAATVSINSFSSELFDTTRPVDQLIDISGELKIATSATIADQAAEDLGRPEDAAQIRGGLDATGATGDTTVTLLYTSTSAADAAEVVNAVALAYLDFRGRAATERQTAALSLVRDRLEELRSQLVTVNRLLSEASPGSAQATAAQSDRTVLVGQITDLTTRENGFSTTVLDPGALVRPATPDQVTESPRPALVVAGAVMLGLVVGLVLSFVRDRRDSRLRDAPHLGEVTGAPVLGSVPSSAYEPGLRAVDAVPLRLVRARLLARLGGAPSSLLVLDLGRRPAMSRLGRHLVSLICAAGRPVTMLRAGSVPPPTFAEEAAVVARARGGGSMLQVVEIGSEADASSLDDALQDPAVLRLVASLRGSGRTVVIVPAWRLDRAGAIALAQAAQNVLVVAERRTTSYEEVAAVCADVRDAGAVVVGAVLCEPSRWRARRMAPEREAPARELATAADRR